MNDSDRAACAEAEAEFEALGIDPEVEEEIELLWFGSAFDRERAVAALVVASEERAAATFDGPGLDADAARSLLKRMYRS